jgi:hypothetical protein
MRYGFTGSSTITFPPQRSAFTSWLSAHRNEMEGLDHGDCVMADEFAHAMVREFTDAKITIHPPTNDSKRAFCMGDHEWLPKPYLARNKDVVDATETLLAMPHGEEELRSGTWSTIRYAHKRGKPVIIFWPDGQITSSEAQSHPA